MKASPTLFLYSVMALCQSEVFVKSYAVTKSPIYSPSILDTDRDQSSTLRERGRDHSIVVRKTGVHDLSEIADLLAHESVSGTDTKNWVANIKKLKARSSFQTQILHRLQAAEAAATVLSYPEHCEFLDTADERDTCRLLWSKDTFRNKLEKAAKTASSFEGADTLWDNHNFAIQPSDPMMMNHIMMTAVDIDFYGGEQNCHDGCIVGFCEVAMLPIPSADGKERGYAPCIANLVVSPNHRRRGIASRMIQNAERFVRLHWAKTLSDCSGYDADLDEDNSRSEGILGLYVDEVNKAATSLYLRENFRITGHPMKDNGRLFLEKEIATSEKS